MPSVAMCRAALVLQLLKEGRAHAPPEEREVAVLFTDIVGFTTASEGMSARETAEFVNHHLSLLGDEIRSRGGTIDKYIGDSVMAFFGRAPPVGKTPPSRQHAPRSEWRRPSGRTT